MGSDTLFPERLTRVSMASIAPRGPDRPCLVVIAGAELGKRVELGDEEVKIGRSEQSGLCINSDLVSRHHATVVRTDDGHALRDEGSTNGTFVNDRRVTGSEPLADGDQIRIGRTVIKYTRSPLEIGYLERVMELATHDALTGAFNKRRFDEAFPAEVARAAQSKSELSLVLFDIDFFKRINDGFGHPAGDAVLREVTRIATACLAGGGLLARVGGEEFAVLLPVGVDGARYAAERMRTAIEGHKFVVDQKEIPVTISLGVAQATESGETPAKLYERADALLYASKHGGRNRVSF
ncbi:MAG TPA: GGDEF domain-containing protein [Polyangiaceae bacterium]|nr:GGDEF domain-containing protein [Polyangiaceae bacterium]